MERNMSSPSIKLIRRATHTDIPRIMAIRHSVSENRLLDPNSVTAADCAALIEGSEIYVQ